MTDVPPIELLRVHRSARGLDEEQLREIAAAAEVVRARAGQLVHDPRDEHASMHLIISGNLRLDLLLPGGKEKPVMYLGRDEQVGLLASLQDEPPPIQVVAQQRSLLLRFAGPTAARLIQDVPLWGRNLLQSLGPKVRDTLLDEKRQRHAKVVALIHSSGQSRQVTGQLIERLTGLGERVGLLGDGDTALATRPVCSGSLVDPGGQMLDPDQARRLVGSWPDTDRVFVDAEINTIGSHLHRLIAAADSTYWFCSPETCSEVVARLQPIIHESPSLAQKISVVHLLGPSQQAAPLVSGLDRVCSVDFKLHVDGCTLVDSPVCTRQVGFQRIVHHLRGVTIGLALGGGAARGMAHLGVLNVLDDAGITIDRMSGTSAGALTGILYAAGYSADFLTAGFASDLKPGRMYRMLPYGDAIYALVKYRCGGWDKMLRKYLSDWRLEQLTIPFSSVAADLVSGNAIVRRTGDAIQAMLESINLPGVSRPICVDGKALVDGGVLNVVPANVVSGQGANFVISSDVSAKIRFEFAGNRPDTATEDMKVPSTAATLTRMRTVQDRNIRSVGGRAADIVIEPDVSSVQITDFKNAPKIAQLGRAAAEEALPEIRSFLHEMDPQLFPLP